MRKEFLKLRPKRYLCPYCGEWHKYLGEEALEESYIKLECEHQLRECSKREILFAFKDDECYFETKPTCGRAYLYIKDTISIADIVESLDKPCVTFSVPFFTHDWVSGYKCRGCAGKENCQIWRLGDESNDHRMMTITFGFEFEQADYEKIVKKQKNTAKTTKPVSAKQQVNEKMEANAMTKKQQHF